MKDKKKSNVEHIGSDDAVRVQLKKDGHSFVILPKADEIGIIDPIKSLDNLSIIVERAKNAFNNEYYIEFISLKIQYLEFFLRIYWVRKNPNGSVLTPETRKLFGTLINECKNYGFKQTLIDKLNDFNSGRIKAIHKYLMGGTSEEELGNVSKKYEKLGNEIQEYVLSEVGTLIHTPEDIPTDENSMIFTTKRN